MVECHFFLVAEPIERGDCGAAMSAFAKPKRGSDYTPCYDKFSSDYQDYHASDVRADPDVEWLDE